MLIGLLFGSYLKRVLSCFIPSSLCVNEIDLDEDLDSYSAVLDEKDRNWTLKEDLYSIDNLGIKILTDEQRI